MNINLSLVTNWDEFEDIRQRHIAGAMQEAGFTFLGAGRHRTTYLAPHKRFVLKFPNSLWGLRASQREAEWWKKNHWTPNVRGVHFAPCHMVAKTILMMRTVVKLYGHTFGCKRGRTILEEASLDDYNPINPNQPKWATWVESNQIGMLANGKWVAYDYADVYED